MGSLLEKPFSAVRRHPNSHHGSSSPFTPHVTVSVSLLSTHIPSSRLLCDTLDSPDDAAYINYS